MHNRLRIIIALVIGIAHPLTLANFLPMKGRWVGEQGWPVLGACILTEELRFLILYHSQQPPFWPPARRVKGRKIRRKRPPHPHLPLKPAEEEELEQPPEGWPKSPHELLDREACVALFERVRWAQGVVCPRCGSWAIRQIPPRTQAGLQCYHCLACQSLFHAATGTLFEHSPLSPTQWMVALLSFAQADSALERADQLAVSRRIGERWQRLFQVILYQQRPQEPLTGEVEVDELYHISGYKGHPNGLNPPRPPRRRRLKRRGRGSWEKDKPPIVVLVKRGGPIRLRVLTNLQKAQCALGCRPRSSGAVGCTPTTMTSTTSSARQDMGIAASTMRLGSSPGACPL